MTSSPSAGRNPRGGGGYPLAGPQTNDQFVSGDYAWNVAGGNPAAGPRFITDRLHQLWITPQGVLKAAAKNGATLGTKKIGERSLTTLSFKEAGRFTATVYLNNASLVERVESRYPDAVLGEVTAVTTYSNYRDNGGIKFPTRIRQKIGGFDVLDITVSKVEPNAVASIAIPDAVRNHVERVTTEKVAEGVWFIAGGSHNSVAIEMQDHVVLVEAPLGDYRMAPVLDEVKKLAPGKPIRFVVNSHQHFGHTGGIRAAATTGATIVTHASSKTYFEKLLAAKSRIAPDMLAKSGAKPPKVMGIKEKGQLTDGKRVIELYAVKDSVHAAAFLFAYLPADKLLIEADSYTPLPPGANPPATPNANHVNMVDNLEGLKLPVAKILPLHGRVVPVSDLYAAIGKRPPQ